MADPPSADNGAALPPLRDIIARHALGARKSLGQHFLLDMNLTRRIARTAGNLSDGTVIEIGPGPGGLTRALLFEGASRVVAVERDERCLEALDELAQLFSDRLKIVASDALKVDTPTLGPAPRRIVANLPYNIATKLLLRWLHDIADDPACYRSLTLMFQTEVAERLFARPNTKAYGRLSVISQWLCSVQPLFNLPAVAFTPPPKVASTVVQLVPRPSPLCVSRIEWLERVTAAAFGHRRKMLRQSLKSLVESKHATASGLSTAELLSHAGIAGNLRAENLDIPSFCALARVLESTLAGNRVR